MVSIELLINNGYAIVLVVSVFVVGFDIVYFLEKVKEKINNHRQNLLNSFQQKYGNNPIKAEDWSEPMKVDK